MNDYYEFVEGSEKEIEPGVIVRRIRAIKEISEFDVFVGDIGGFVQNKSNLTSASWCADDACIYDDAVVCKGSLVISKCKIFGKAKLSSGVRVSSKVEIGGNVNLTGLIFVGNETKILGNEEVTSTLKYYINLTI